jgi:hypothetical protein
VLITSVHLSKPSRGRTPIWCALGGRTQFEISEGIKSLADDLTEAFTDRHRVRVSLCRLPTPGTNDPGQRLVGSLAPLPLPDCAGCGRVTSWGPLHFRYLVRLAAPTVSTPLRDFYLPRDQSVQPRLLPAGPPDEFARFPLAPRRPF